MRGSGRPSADEFGGGLAIYDVSRPSAPKLITKWMTAGGGVHRFDFDGRYAYISPTVEGYVGNIVMILDLADPARPREVGRWWIPGQWEAGGEDLSVGRLGPRRAAIIRCAWRPALCQLLASRAFHSRHFRSVEAESKSHTPIPARSIPAPDAYLSADSRKSERPRHHGGGGRGRRQAVASAAVLHLDLRHHQ